jgi:hypothetical protein
MDRKSFEYALRTFSMRAPYRPFVVELVSGTRLVIHHPEALAFGGGRAIYIDTTGEWSVFDDVDVCQITSQTDPSASE